MLTAAIVLAVVSLLALICSIVTTQLFFAGLAIATSVTGIVLLIVDAVQEYRTGKSSPSASSQPEDDAQAEEDNTQDFVTDNVQLDEGEDQALASSEALLDDLAQQHQGHENQQELHTEDIQQTSYNPTVASELLAQDLPPEHTASLSQTALIEQLINHPMGQTLPPEIVQLLAQQIHMPVLDTQIHDDSLQPGQMDSSSIVISDENNTDPTHQKL